MKTRYRIIGFVLVFLITLSACMAQTPTAIASLPPVLPDTQIPVTVTGQLIPTLPPPPPPSGAMAVEFLADNSGSVVQSGCGDTAKIAYSYINFLSKNLFQQIPNSNSLYVGIGQFGKAFHKIYSPTTDYGSLQEVYPVEPYDQQTQFISGIQGALDNLNSSIPNPGSTKKILVVLTDGEFDTENSEDVFEFLRKELVADQNLTIYVNLICSQASKLSVDVNEWEQPIDSSGRIVVMPTEQVGEWFSLLIDDLHSYIPAGIQYLESFEG